MNPHALHGPFKAIALVILVLMLIAMLYGGYISFIHWEGIGV